MENKTPPPNGREPRRRGVWGYWEIKVSLVLAIASAALLAYIFVTDGVDEGIETLTGLGAYLLIAAALILFGWGNVKWTRRK